MEAWGVQLLRAAVAGEEPSLAEDVGKTVKKKIRFSHEVTIIKWQ